MPTLTPFLRTGTRAITAESGVFEGHPCELGCGGFVSAHTDDVTVIVYDISEIEMVSITLKEYGW